MAKKEKPALYELGPVVPGVPDWVTWTILGGIVLTIGADMLEGNKVDLFGLLD
ncbi:MAG: hypothetical protein ACJKTH_00395 [Patescibacteria group bacterium UBA2163]